MSNKEIRLKWLSDDSEIDKSIQRLQQKLQQMNRTSAQMQNIQETGGTLSPNALKAKGAFESSQRAILEKERREVEMEQRKESQFLTQKQRQLERLEKIEGNLTQQQKERLSAMKEELQLKVNMSSAKVLQQEQTKAQIDKNLGVDTRGGQQGGGGEGSLGGLMSRIAKSLDPAKIAAAMVGSARMYGQYLAIEQTREREVQGYRGAQTQAQNISFQDTMSNKGFMRYFEGGERTKALQMAMAERQKRLSGDPLRAAANIGGQALAGGAAGSFLGGPVGTALGVAAGAGNAIFGDKGVYRQIFDREAYMADVNAQTMQNYRGNIANLRMQDPEKYAAMEQFGKRAGNLQKMQRRLQLSDEELLGGGYEDVKRRSQSEMSSKERTARGTTILNPKRGQKRADGTTEPTYIIKETDEQILARRGAIDERNANRQKGFIEGQQYDRSGARAFSEERIKENMQNIFSAGGSTGFVRGDERGRGAQVAAEYQRAGFTGAAREMGQISGVTGGGKQTEDAYVKLLAEGVKLGFNASKPSEEMRKFTSIAAQMYRATGGAEAGVAMMAKTITGGSMAEIEAGQRVFGRRNQEAGESESYRGALKQSYLQSKDGKEKFGKISENMKQYFTEADLETLDKDNLMVKEFADKQFGGDTDKAIDAIREMQEYGSNLSQETDDTRTDLRAKYNTWLKDKGKKNDKDSRKEFLKSPEGQSAGAKYQAAYAMERKGVGAMDAQEVQSNVGFVLGGKGGETAEGGIGVDVTKGKGVVTEKPEASTAADQIAQMVIVAQNIEKLTDAFSKNANASLHELKAAVKTTDMEEFIKQIEKSDKELAAAIFSAFATSGSFSMIPTQPTTGNEEEK